ncbi:ABC transporter permease [Actinomadura parmotrematis]|uniref:ABC transporter permease subunit n=1 Tax=Actinomadura parmotrematis TaxID=2864039 RepID=A0ABS7FZJ5_9ACTN|nr:ABC transporter permease subunit [Actinomadura parmotrematis]MBW8485870.1 ABC transporter permease subunit [Actinomadura parmotrematis]
MSPARRLAVSAASVAVLCGCWEAAPRLGLAPDASLPPLSRVLAGTAAVLGDAAFRDQLAVSAARWAAGLGCAVLAGVPLGVAMGRAPLLRRLVEPLLALLYPVPKVALVVPLLLVLGQRMPAGRADETARVAVIALGCLIPLTVSAAHGAAGVEPRLLWTARAAGAGRVRRLAAVVLPAALPQVLSGLRIALAVSLFTLVGAELLVRGQGVGAYLFDAYDIGEYTRVWAVTVLVAATGLVLDTGYALAVRRLLPWWEGEV